MADKVLIIKHGALGDFILSLGAMKAIAERHAEAHLTLMTTAAFRGLAERTGFFDDIVIDDRKSWDISNYLRMCKSVVADGGFSRVYDLQKSKRTRVKYFNLVRFFLKKPLQWAFVDADGLVVRQLIPKRAVLAEVVETRTPFEIPLSDVSFLKGPQEHFSELPEKFILMIPGCSAAHPYKRWSAANYAAIARKALKHGVNSVVLGTAEEKSVIEEICASSEAINFMNKATLFDIPALAQRAAAVVGNDTGPAHMASYASAHTVLLFAEITRRSAEKFNVPGVNYLIAENIDDTSPETVWRILEKDLFKGETE